MELIVEGFKTPEDQQAFTDFFTKVLFETYIEHLEKDKENKNIRA